MHARDAQHGCERSTDTLENAFRRRGAENFLSQVVGLAQSLALPAQPPLAAPQGKADTEQHDEAKSQHQRLHQPIAIRGEHKAALRTCRKPSQSHQQSAQTDVAQTARFWAITHEVKNPLQKLSAIMWVPGKLT